MTDTLWLKGFLVPFVELLPSEPIRHAFSDAFERESTSILAIEAFFRNLPNQKPSDAALALFFQSWRATHLKMLAIYGLSCRLQRQASSANSEDRLSYLLAASANAETSYEDLGLDFEGVTHADLYDEMVAQYLPGELYRQARPLPEAVAFGKWIYRNMVVESPLLGLLTNLFSEIYNHGEYSLALRSFQALTDQYYDWNAEKRDHALTYIGAHVAGETELEHFKVVWRALEYYREACGEAPEREATTRLFAEYLRRLGAIMSRLREEMAALA